MYCIYTYVYCSLNVSNDKLTLVFALQISVYAARKNRRSKGNLRANAFICASVL